MNAKSDGLWLVAGKLCRGGDAKPIPESRDGDEIVLIDRRNGRRLRLIADRNRQAVTLDGIDRQLDADLSGQDRAVRSEREHICFARELASIRACERDAITGCLEARIRRSGVDLPSPCLDNGRERSRELRGIAGFIGRAIDAAGDFVPGRLNRGIERQNACAIEDLDDLTICPMRCT